AILMNLLEDAIILFRPRIRQQACSRSFGTRLPSWWGPRQPLLGTDDPHLDLDLLALGHAQVFVGFNGLAVDFSDTFSPPLQGVETVDHPLLDHVVRMPHWWHKCLHAWCEALEAAAPASISARFCRSCELISCPESLIDAPPRSGSQGDALHRRECTWW